MKTKIFLMIAALAIFSFTSCDKQSDIDQTSIDLANDDAVSDAIYEDVFSSVDNADIILDNYMKSGYAKSAVADSCPLVTIDHPDDAKWPKTITIDFGTLCTGLYDNTRSGKIITVVTGPRLQQGSKKTVTFDNYYVNGIKVEGTKVIENMGYNNNQNMVFTATLTGGKLTLVNGRTIERSFTHEREWIAGLLTKYIWDDECFITGTANGITLKGVSFTNTITSALHWKRVCRFIVSGVVKIEREGLEPVVLNYGEGECDAKATLTMGDQTKEILLKYHR
ncbi:MAG: hypothetical protein MUF36_02720 [Bacteroidales bacterium]|jgi:hypothetical protein|nr:hypothetical protein [Bacteroidales bacterium]